jgi:tetratricopeptide (TPR) repeat protein
MSRKLRRLEKKLQRSTAPKTPAVDGPFAEAFQHHLAGRLQEAETIYRRILAVDPRHADSLHLLGAIAYQRQQFEDAVTLIGKAIEINPRVAQYHSNLGNALMECDRLTEAFECQQRAIATDSGYAEAYNNLANILWKWEKYDTVISLCEKAVSLKPGMAEAHNNIGKALAKKSKFDEAVARFKLAVHYNPNFIDAYNSLGHALVSQGLPGAAADWLNRVIAMKPDFAEAHVNLGHAQMNAGRIGLAFEAIMEALRLQPNHELAWAILDILVRAWRYAQVREGGGGQDHLPRAYPAEARATHHFAFHRYMVDVFSGGSAVDASLDAALAAMPDETLHIGGTQAHPAEFADRMVALLHFGRSGTGLLHSLIDGHPEISTLPATYLQGYFGRDTWQRLTREGWQRLPERFVEIFEVLFDARSPRPVPGLLGEDNAHKGMAEGMTSVGDNHDEWLSVDAQRFCAEAHRLLDTLAAVDPASFLKIVHVAYERALGATVGKNTIFYHLHYSYGHIGANFMRHCPGAKIIMMVREPIQCCESWLRQEFTDGNYEEVTNRIGRMLVDIDQVAFRRHDAVGLRLEDLKAKPAAAIRALCDWMGVAEDPCLYRMTAQGKRWWGDPSGTEYARAADPFDPACLVRKSQPLLSDRDRLILATLYYPFSVRFGYQVADPGKFRRDLDLIRPMLDRPMDFEMKIRTEWKSDAGELERTGKYLHFHSILVDRWEMLDRFGDYPAILTPLKVDA